MDSNSLAAFARTLPPARALFDLRTPMRDGIELSSDVFLARSDEPRPVVLQRTPYGNHWLPLTVQARMLAESGYTVVLQDVRGRHDSEGQWRPFQHEGQDGFDTIEWIAQQPWCDGRVAMMGGSYAGYVQWAAARECPPHLVGLASAAAAGNFLRELPYDNGMLQLVGLVWAFYTSGRVCQDTSLVDWETVLRHLPVRDADLVLGARLPAWQEWLEHPQLDDYWQSLRLDSHDFARIDLPVLHVTGWYDADQSGALFFYDGMVRHSPARQRQALVVGPWDHIGACFLPRAALGGVEFGEGAVLSHTETHLAWFSHLFDGAPAEGMLSGTHLFLTGANVWEHSPLLPSGLSEQQLFLGDGTLEDQAGCAGSRTLKYDPLDPLQLAPISALTASGDDLGEDGGTPLERSWIVARPDVLSYEGAETEIEMDLVGTPEAVLHVSSDCIDTDLVVWLHDVSPGGSSQYLCGAGLRLMYRHGLAERRPLQPGVVEEVRVKLSPLHHRLRRGHRLRLTVTSSDFPNRDRNLNTGEPGADGVRAMLAFNTVHHGGHTPSRLEIGARPPMRA